MTRPRRVGVLGGTFDPVHVAHLHIAACARHDLALDEVRFVPAGSPPHKPGVPLSPAGDRLRMLELATTGVDGFLVDPIDLAAHVPSYTSELLQRIRRTHPRDDLWFIVGADSLAEFHTWHEPARILSLARLAVAARPGWDIHAALAKTTLPALGASVDLFSSVPIDLSATLIRQRVREGLPVDWLLPTAVHAWVAERGLYRAGTPDDR